MPFAGSDKEGGEIALSLNNMIQQIVTQCLQSNRLVAGWYEQPAVARYDLVLGRMCAAVEQVRRGKIRGRVITAGIERCKVEI